MLGKWKWLGIEFQIRLVPPPSHRNIRTVFCYFFFFLFIVPARRMELSNALELVEREVKLSEERKWQEKPIFVHINVHINICISSVLLLSIKYFKPIETYSGEKVLENENKFFTEKFLCFKFLTFFHSLKRLALPSFMLSLSYFPMFLVVRFRATLSYIVHHLKLAL